MSFLVNVPYLEDNDFTDQHTLKQHVHKNKPTVLMVQGSFCGYCKAALGDFQEFANQANNYVAATLQIDGGPTEKAAVSRVSKMYPEYRGVPLYMGFDKNGKYVTSVVGKRNLSALQQFVQQL